MTEPVWWIMWDVVIFSKTKLLFGKSYWPPGHQFPISPFPSMSFNLFQAIQCIYSQTILCITSYSQGTMEGESHKATKYEVKNVPYQNNGLFNSPSKCFGIILIIDPVILLYNNHFSELSPNTNRAICFKCTCD